MNSSSSSCFFGDVGLCGCLPTCHSRCDQLALHQLCPQWGLQYHCFGHSDFHSLRASSWFAARLSVLPLPASCLPNIAAVTIGGSCRSRSAASAGEVLPLSGLGVVSFELPALFSQHPSQGTTHPVVFFTMAHAKGSHRFPTLPPQNSEVLPHEVTDLRKSGFSDGALQELEQLLGPILLTQPGALLALDGRSSSSSQLCRQLGPTGVAKLHLVAGDVQPGACSVCCKPCQKGPDTRPLPDEVHRPASQFPNLELAVAGGGLASGCLDPLPRRAPLPCRLAGGQLEELCFGLEGDAPRPMAESQEPIGMNTESLSSLPKKTLFVGHSS